MHEYNNIFLCKIITQYTCTCLHSIAVETESTLVDIIVKGCMHVFSNNIPCMASLLYKFSEHTFNPGICSAPLKPRKKCWLCTPNNSLVYLSGTELCTEKTTTIVQPSVLARTLK